MGPSARFRRNGMTRIIQALFIAGCSGPSSETANSPADGPVAADASPGDAQQPQPDGRPPDARLRFDARTYVDAPPPDPDPAPMTLALRTIELASNDLVYDALRGVLYASVPSSAGSSGNSIATIDPRSGLVVDSLMVGGEPRPLAISDDFSTLYVGLNSNNSVRRLDLATRNLEEPITFTPDPIEGATFAVKLAVMPGTPHTFVAVLSSQAFFDFAGAVIYDERQPRPLKWGDPTGGFAITFGEPGMLYAYDGQDTSFQFFELFVDPDGIRVGRTISNLFTGFGVSITFDHGQIFSSSGRVAIADSLALAGTYGAKGPVAIDPTGTIVSFLAATTLSASSPIALKRFQRDTFLPIDQLNLPTDVDASMGIRGLVQWSGDGLAFIAGSRTYLIDLKPR